MAFKMKGFPFSGSALKTHDQSKDASDTEIAAVIKDIRSIEKRLGMTAENHMKITNPNPELEKRRDYLYRLRETTHSD